MKTLHAKPLLIAGTLALLGAGAAPHGAAFAQAEQQLPEVLIGAGPVSRALVGRSPTSNAPAESVTVNYGVRYSDLDLSKHADVLALQGRVQMAARDACGQLDELFPIDSSHQQTRSCIESAVRGASRQVEEAINPVQKRASAAVTEVPTRGRAEASLPQARARITNWALDSYKGIWIEAGSQWYYAEFLGPCFGAVPDHIAFSFSPDGSLNRFSRVIVPREHQVCAFRSFSRSAGPDARGLSSFAEEAT